jgi:hypothetical protein
LSGQKNLMVLCPLTPLRSDALLYDQWNSFGEYMHKLKHRAPARLPANVSVAHAPFAEADVILLRRIASAPNPPLLAFVVLP